MSMVKLNVSVIVMEEGRDFPSGSNPDQVTKGEWASTRGNGSLMGAVSHRRFPLGTRL